MSFLSINQRNSKIMKVLKMKSKNQIEDFFQKPFILNLNKFEGFKNGN